MKTPLKIVCFVMLLALILLPARSASAKGLADGRVIFGQSFTLESGDTLNGDLVVFGGSAEIEAGATVNGNLVLMGGSLVIDGKVTGDVSVIGGSVTLNATAHIGRNLSTVGATLTRAEGARVDGEIYNTATAWNDGQDGGDDGQPPVVTPVIPDWWSQFNPLWSAANVFGQALAMGILAMLVALFLAAQTGRVAQAIVAQPVIAGGLGLLTLVLAPAAIFLLAITFILIPVALVAVFMLVIAAVFGWIALGMEIGLRAGRMFGREWHPALAAGVGTFVLTLIAESVSSIPVVQCVGFLVPFIFGLMALGGVLMSRFGTQAVLPPAPPAAPDYPQPVVHPEAPRKPRSKKAD